jgi:hypothetical protein
MKQLFKFLSLCLLNLSILSCKQQMTIENLKNVSSNPAALSKLAEFSETEADITVSMVESRLGPSDEYGKRTYQAIFTKGVPQELQNIAINGVNLDLSIKNKKIVSFSEGENTQTRFASLGQEVGFNFVTTANAKTNEQKEGFYLPKSIRLLQHPFGYVPVKKGFTLTWEADGQNTIGVVIKITYESEENAQYYKHNPTYLLVADNGNYHLSEKDFVGASYDENGKLKGSYRVEIARGNYKLTKIEDISCKLYAYSKASVFLSLTNVSN